MISSCLIVDDEPLARKLLASYVAKIDGLVLAGECGSALEAMNALQKRKIDLLFLDIQMPEFTGLQLIKTLKSPPAIILTTAHREFAADAFDLNVLDYLMKPVSFERFLKAVNKYFDHVPASASAPVEGPAFLMVRSERKMLKLPVEQILYVESLDDIVKIHMTGNVVITRENISSRAQQLPASRFIRLHRSFIAAQAHITTITGEGVEIGKRFIPFGRAYKQAAWKQLGM